ncbi:ATP-binding protein, partial [Aliarcobacter butzleri]
KIKDTNLIFPMVLSSAKQKLINKVVACENSAKKLANIPHIDIYVVKDLYGAIEILKSNLKDEYLYKKEFHL